MRFLPSYADPAGGMCKQEAGDNPLVDNRQIGRVLHEIADLLDIKGDDAFRIRSYRMAAESVESCGHDIGGILRRGEALPRLPAVGKGTQAQVRDIREWGPCAFHQ